MSAANRNLARLPPEIFADLLLVKSKNDLDVIISEITIYASPKQLRDAICIKLKSFRRKTLTGKVVHDSVKTVGAFLRQSIPTLLRALDPLLTYDECRELYRRICVYCAPKACDALTVLNSTRDVASSVLSPVNNDLVMRYLPSGLSTLDHCLRGGVRIGTLTEFVGRAGVGKTQLAMQLCVEAAARYGQGSVFIDTERKLSVDRLKEIAVQRSAVFNAAHNLSSPDDGGGFSYDDFGTFGNDAVGQTNQHLGTTPPPRQQYQSPHDVLQNVSVYTPVSTEELLALTSTIEEEVVLRNEEAKKSAGTFPVRLLILDSIAAPARRDFGSGSAPQRAAVICQIAQTLKRLADQLQLAVIVINQAGSTREVDNADENSHQYNSNSSAALGTAWHHCVSTRILVEIVNSNQTLKVSLPPPGSTEPTDNASMSSGTKNPTPGNILRRASIVKSNLAGYGSARFEVTKMGISEPTQQQVIQYQ